MAIPNPGYWWVNFGDGSTTGYYALTKWATGTVTAAGAMVRQNAAPAVGSERVFICIIAGTTHASTEPTWVTTKGAKTTDNTVTWMECTGQAALNGSLTYTSGWTSGPGGVGTGVKNQAVALGYIIARDNGASYQICTTAGTAGNGAEPSFSNTAGTTTGDNTVTWTSLGVVGNFTTAFGAPHARLVNAFTANWGAAGDIFWVGDNHAETQAAILTLNPPGTLPLPNFVYCVDHTKTSPGTGDLKTSATVTTTGGNALSVISDGSTTRSAAFNGLIFQSGTGAVTASLSVAAGSLSHFCRLDNCSLSIVATATGSHLNIGTGQGSIGGAKVLLNNTTVSFGAAGQFIDGPNCGEFVWMSTASAVLGTTPTLLFSPSSGNGTTLNAQIRGVDLSALGSGKTIIDTTSRGAAITFTDCKLGASVTLSSTPTCPSGQHDFIRCDSAGTNYFQSRYKYQGTLSQETVDVRTAGATDGTTPLSWKIVSTANATWVSPFECFPIAIWNATTGSSVTATVEIINDGATLNTDDIWIEAEYLGSASTPLASFANSTKANNLATGTAITTSTAAWTTTGIVTPITQKMSVSFTPQLAGYIIVRVYVAKASKTIWVDPLITLS